MEGIIMLKKLTVISVALLSLAGCTNGDIYSGDVYSAQQAKQVQSVTYGTITSLRPVKVQTGTDSDGLLGTVGGAVIGGFLGNTVGGGTGRALATAAGAVAGGVAGKGIEGKLGESNGVEIEVKRDSGSTIAVVQTVGQTRFSVGQRVRLADQGGTITVSPL
jgi:outer membrane lipoprotein SlyB